MARPAFKFKRHLRRHAFGWKGSRLAAKRIGEAERELKKTARKDPVAGAEGAVDFVERLYPAVEQADDSRGFSAQPRGGPSIPRSTQ